MAGPPSFLHVINAVGSCNSYNCYQTLHDTSLGLQEGGQVLHSWRGPKAPIPTLGSGEGSSSIQDKL